jgi:hypothetical protein
MLALLAAGAVLGCSPAQYRTYFARETVGHVGCPEREIRIRDEHSDAGSGLQTWTAVCRGKVYYCRKQDTALGFGATDSRGTSCHAAD